MPQRQKRQHLPGCGRGGLRIPVTSLTPRRGAAKLPPTWTLSTAKGASPRLRSMLDDAAFSYASIARRFGVTRQYVSLIAKEMGIDGRHRQRERTLRTTRFYDNGTYPATVKAVAHAIKRHGMEVLPYRPPRYRNGVIPRASKRMLLIEGVPCRIHCRREASKTRPRGREYALFHISARTKEAKAAVFAFWRHGTIKLFVVPTSELKNISTLWLPADGRYADQNNHKPRRDWTVYEGAWRLLKRQRRA
jgi:hypothetical protein